MGRKYHAIVYGRLTLPGTVDQPIGRHPHHRTRMSVRRDAREAVTHYRPLSQYTEHTLVELMLETGRTHQIRVHMQHLHYPLIGDGLYGGTYRKPKLGSEALSEAIRSFPRQALHASELVLVHPETSEVMTFESELPIDIKVLMASLKAG
jgi:23S rRNA pseudouridine1911/1915/1917 synthase